MLTTIFLAAFLAAPPATWADPFAPAGPLAIGDFYAPPRPPEKPSPFANDETAADSLEWWALDQDWAETVAKAAPLVEVMSTRQQQRIIYSALLCRAVEDLTAPGRSTETARRRLAAIGVLATDRLERARIVPLACAAWPVARLAACLGLLPGPECVTDESLKLQVQAAERIAP